ADVIATAHHLNDNAETVLFNIARGSSVSGASGISYENKKLKIIRPLISTSREEIDNYIIENNVPFVEDETNFTEDYTRNKIRLNVLPELEQAVHGAAKNIYRFSRLAAEDEEYFQKLIEERRLLNKTDDGYALSLCEEKVIFRRAVVMALEALDKKDYTFAQAQTLYGLQFAENGKRFEFLNLTAYKEGDKIVICPNRANDNKPCVPLDEYLSQGCENFCGEFFKITDRRETTSGLKVLKFDKGALPENCEVRFMREGDKFTKFGGGTKNLGDYFTDLKIPKRVRGNIPLIAKDNEVLIIGGVEISDRVKITEKTTEPNYIICNNYKVK
ncbi:MAG: tRNA lysidine(34) synthetase TilS, partial [Clostridia bacterium]|nr:tRNA lysidine(34) synthetase TilS [Clostridia bacterium]